MAKLEIYAYTKDKNNSELKTPEELLKEVSNFLGGYVAWIDLVDSTNETTFIKEEEENNKNTTHKTRV
jgi:hypothetical protein